MQDIEVRLQTLERGLRRWKLVSVALALGLIGLAVVAAGPGDVQELVRCRRFEVVNDKGTVIARIENLPRPRGGDGGWFTCYGNDGSLKLRMGAQVGGDAQLSVMSGTENTDSFVTVNTSPEGGGQITLNGPNQAPYVRLAAPPGQPGAISISNPTGKPLWHAGP